MALPKYLQILRTTRPEILVLVDWRLAPVEIALPTQVVVRSAAEVHVRHARAYYLKGEYATGPDPFLLQEVWEDMGMDGSTDFQMQGWRLVRLSDLEAAQHGPLKDLLEYLGLREEEW